jgi:hypothetical protein
MTLIAQNNYNLRDLGKRRLGLDESVENDTTIQLMTDVGSRLPQNPKQALLSEIVGRMNDMGSSQNSENKAR